MLYSVKNFTVQLREAAVAYIFSLTYWEKYLDIMRGSGVLVRLNRHFGQKYPSSGQVGQN